RPLSLGALLGGTFRRRLLRHGAELLLRAALFSRTTLLDRALHRGALLGGSLFFLGAPLCGLTAFLVGATLVFGPALRGRALFRRTTLGADALFFGTALHRCLLRRGAFRGRAFGRDPFFVRALLFVSASFLCRQALLDRALHRGVLRGSALLLFGAPFLG
ncbi:MAG: hypothetical protein M3O80_05035, partial [Chloroflexota bacterium]|nr:hypothetical protein [Chloroflexota bacterium]